MASPGDNMAAIPIEDSVLEDVLDKIADGGTIREACKSAGLSLSGFMKIVNSGRMVEQYARAMELRAASLFDDMLAISDSDAVDVQRDKLRVDTRKWALSKMMPKKYGDKLETTIEGGEKPVTVKVVFDK